MVRTIFFDQGVRSWDVERIRVETAVTVADDPTRVELPASVRMVVRRAEALVRTRSTEVPRRTAVPRRGIAARVIGNLLLL